MLTYNNKHPIRRQICLSFRQCRSLGAFIQPAAQHCTTAHWGEGAHCFIIRQARVNFSSSCSLFGISLKGLSEVFTQKCFKTLQYLVNENEEE